MTSPAGRVVYVYQVAMDGGEQDLASVLEPAFVVEYGLCEEAILGKREPGADDVITPERFQPNRAFVQYLRDLVATHVDIAAELVAEARACGEGELVVVDRRSRSPRDAPADDDVLGTVLVRAGEMLPGSFQFNPGHRLLTAHGFFLLPPELEAVLDHDLRVRCVAAHQPGAPVPHLPGGPVLYGP